ncbi:MAG TPA: cytochrome c3 family protein [Desulfomonilaceae bacterium]|nr:cytochrome c3 family protein [Desulfomonilaceae bacterium]
MSDRAKMLVALVGAAFIAAITLAYAATQAPDHDIVISSKEVFKEPKKTPVTFSHAKHKEFKCTECHHEYKDGKNVWQEGQEVKKCYACHKLEAQDKIVSLQKAYHDKCQSCHKKMKKEKKKTGPTACSKCHPGAADEGEGK